MGGRTLLVAGRRDRDLPDEKPAPVPRGISLDRKLLDSFLALKNAELKEYFRRPELSEPRDQGQAQMGEIFAFTKKILSRILGPLDFRLIRDDDLLERALQRVHLQLPFPFRLILRKKRYIELMLENRERLVS
jgi:hypothetical protein